MALYEVEGPDGVVYEVEGVEGATDSEIINALKTHLSTTSAPTKPEPIPDFVADATRQYEEQYGEANRELPNDTNWMQDLAYGAGAGFVGTGEMVALGAATAYEEEEELEARKKIQDTFAKITPESGNKDSIFYGIGNALGSAIGFGTAGTAVALAAPYVGVSAGIAGIAGTAALGIAASRGEASERARAGGASLEEKETAINNVMITLAGAAEAVPLTRVFKKINLPVFQKVVDKLGPKTTAGWGAKIYNGLLTGGMEAGQEVAQNIAQNLTEKEYNSIVEWSEGAVSSAGYGGAAGFILDMFLGGRKRSSLVSEEEEKINPLDEFIIGQEEFDTVVEEESRAGRNDTQIDMFSTELDDAEAAQPVLSDAEETTQAQALVDEDTYADIQAEEDAKTAPKQLDMVDQLETEQTQELIDEDTYAAIQAEEDAKARLRQESELESAAGRIEGRAISESDARRESILQEVIETTPTNNYNKLDKAFQKKLADEGYTDTTTNKREAGAIQRAVNFQKADKQANAPIPSDSDTSGMEAQIPEKRVVAQEKQVDQTGPTESEKVAIASNLTALINKNKKEPSTEIMAGRLEKSIAKDKRRNAAPKETSVEASIDTSSPSQRTINPETGKFRFRDSNKLIGTHAELADDIKAIDDFTTLKIPQSRKETSEAKREVLKQERAAQKYLSQFDTPADAFLNAISEAADPKSLTYKVAPATTTEQDIDPLEKNLKGTGGPNAKLLLSWAHDNLSAETNTQLDRKLAAEKDKMIAREKTIIKKEEAKAADEKQAKERAIAKDKKTEQEEAAEEELNAKAKARQEAAEADETVKQINPTKKSIKEINSEKMQAARDSADENFDKLLKNPKTDFTSTYKGVLTTKASNNLRIAEEYASASNDPDGRARKLQEFIKEKRKTNKADRAKEAKKRADTTAKEAKEAKSSNEQINKDAADVKRAEKNLDKKKGEEVKKRTPIQKILDAAAKKHPKLTFRELSAAFQFVSSDYTRSEKVEGIKQFFDTATTEDIKNAVEAYDKQKALLLGIYPLQVDAETATSLDMDVPDSVMKLVQAGDIKAALEELSLVTKSKRVKRIARALANNMGTTKIEIAKNNLPFAGSSILNDGRKEGDISVAMFNPKTNTITLRSNAPTTVHTLLHEATHAATISILSNKSNPHTIQLKKLYETVLPLLDSDYGATNLEEFVAEVFSNVVLQRKLSQITMEGESLSVLQKIFRAITNFVRGLQGLDTKPIESALDAADASIEAILAPAPEYRNLGVLYNLAPKKLDKLLTRVVANQQDTPQKRKGLVVKAIDFLSDGTNLLWYKNIILGGFNTLMLGEVSRAVGFKMLGIRLHEALLRGRYRIQESKTEVASLLKKANELLSEDSKLEALMDDVALSTAHGSTIYQVNPRLTEDAAKKKYAKDKDKMRIWYAQRPSWNKLGKDGQEAYIAVEEHYKKKNKELQDTISRELESVIAQGENDSEQGRASAKKASNSLREQVYNKLFENSNLEVYFPLVREGNYKLVYKVKNPEIEGGQDYVVLMFASDRERKLLQIELKKDPNVINESMETIDPEDSLVTSEAFKQAPPTSFVAQTLKVLRDNDINETTQEQVLKLFVDALPQTSFAKSLQRRKNIEGFIPSVLDGVRIKGSSLGQQIARLQTRNVLNDIMTEIKNTEYDDSSRFPLKEFNRMKGEFQLRVDFAIKGANNPNVEGVVRVLNQVAFLYTIGTNVSSAIIQTAQIPMVVAPLLGARYGYDKTYNAFMDAKSIVVSSVGNTATKGIGISAQIDNYYDLSDTGEFTIKQEVLDKIHNAYTGYPTKAKNVIAELENLIPLVRVALESSSLHKGYVADQLSLGEYATKASGGGSLPKRIGKGVKDLHDSGYRGAPKAASDMLNAVTAASAVPFTAADKFNRQTTLIMAYNLILEDMVARKKEGKKYYSYREGRVIDVPTTKSLMQRQAALDANNFADKSNGATVIETGTRFAQQDIRRATLMYKNYGMAMYYLQLKASLTSIVGSNLDPKARKVALKEFIGMSLSALLFAGVRGMPFVGVALVLANTFIDDDEEDAETILRKYVGEFMYKGPIAGITGIDISTRLKMNDLIIQENRFAQDNTVEEDIVRNLGGPAWSTLKRFGRSGEDFIKGNYYRSFEQAVPQGITNGLSVIRENFLEDGKRTRRNDEIIKDITWGEDFARVVGFPSIRYNLQQEQTMQEKRIQKSILKQFRDLNKKYYVKAEQGDFDGLSDVVDDIKEFNLKHPNAGIDIDAFARAQASHARITEDMEGGVTFNKLFEKDRQRRLRGYKN